MRAFKDGGVSTCFHCHRQLVRIKGGFIWSLIFDPDGNKLRVHKQCVKHAIGDGYREVKDD